VGCSQSRLPAGAPPKRPPEFTSLHERPSEATAPTTAAKGVPGNDLTLTTPRTPTSGQPSAVRSGSSSKKRPKPLTLVVPPDARHNVSKLLDWLIVGGDEISRNFVLLRDMNVRNVVNATAEGLETFPEDFQYVRLSWTDVPEQRILADLETAFSLIDDARSRNVVCLVHCRSGMSRSGAIAVAYVMRTMHISLLEALAFCRDKRAIIAPNAGTCLRSHEWSAAFTA
jgi:protein-tyrosine phosphatase